MNALPMPTCAGGPVVRARGVTKVYGGTAALDSVDFEVHSGAVNVLIGENGAGKSTLMRILAGVERPTAGELLFGEEPIELHSPRDAAALGIGIIHQELSLFPGLSVADNIFVGRARTRHGLGARTSHQPSAAAEDARCPATLSRLGVLDAPSSTPPRPLDRNRHWTRRLAGLVTNAGRTCGLVLDRGVEERRVAETLALLEQPIDPRTLVGRLPLGLQQIVEVSRALVHDVRILMMDEPTSALSAAEVAALFRVIRDLVKRGVAVVYISHRLEELMQIGDFITVLRDGRRVAHAAVTDIDLGWIVENMVGRTGSPPQTRDTQVQEAKALTVEGLSLPGPGDAPLLDRISLSVRRGEIVALYGLMGAGRTELLESLAGARSSAGHVAVDGAPVHELSLPQRIRRGLTLIPEDRQGAGIVQPLSVTHNVTLSSLGEHARGFWMSGRREHATMARMKGELDIRTADPDRPITTLSGGNQQKAVVARALLTSPRVLLMDEPTRGIDVAARAEMFDLMRRLAGQGLAILYSSSDLKEVVGIADRILVLSNGRLTGEFDGRDVSDSRLVEASYVGHVRQARGDDE